MQNLPFLKSVKNKMSALLVNVLDFFFVCLFFKKKTCGFSASILKIDKKKKKLLSVADSCHACFQKRFLLFSISNDHSEVCSWKMKTLNFA